MSEGSNSDHLKVDEQHDPWRDQIATICDKYGVPYTEWLTEQIGEIRLEQGTDTDRLFHDSEWWIQMRAARTGLEKLAAANPVVHARLNQPDVVAQQLRDGISVVKAALAKGHLFGFPDGRRVPGPKQKAERDGLLGQLVLVWERATGQRYRFHDKSLKLRPTPWLQEMALLLTPELSLDEVIRGLEQVGKWSPDDIPRGDLGEEPLTEEEEETVRQAECVDIEERL